MGNEIIYNPIFNWRLSKDVDILSIRNVDYLTRIDFIHFASIDWGSINIEENIFIRPSGTDLNLFLVKAEHIPIAPKVHYYEALEDYLCFTLYFPALPIGTKEIDIIRITRKYLVQFF